MSEVGIQVWFSGWWVTLETGEVHSEKKKNKVCSIVFVPKTKSHVVIEMVINWNNIGILRGCMYKWANKYLHLC